MKFEIPKEAISFNYFDHFKVVVCRFVTNSRRRPEIYLLGKIFSGLVASLKSEATPTPLSGSVVFKSTSLRPLSIKHSSHRRSIHSRLRTRLLVRITSSRSYLIRSLSRPAQEPPPSHLRRKRRLSPSRPMNERYRRGRPASVDILVHS